MAEYGVATISVLMPHSRLRPRAADLPRSWNTTQPSPISATHIGKRLAGKLHEPFERAGGGRAKTPPLPTLHRCRHRRRKGREVKPLRGKGGRKVETRGLEWSKSSRECPQGLHKRQKPAGLTGSGREHRSGRSAWCRRWSTASKGASGTA